LEKIRRFLRNPLTVASPSEGRVLVEGWFYDPNLTWITLNCQADGKRRSDRVQRIGSPDIARAFNNPDATQQRFSIKLSGNEECSLAVDGLPESSILIRPLLGKKNRRFVFPSGGTLYCYSIDHVAAPVLSDIPSKTKRRLNLPYQTTMPWVVLMGFLSYLLHVVYVTLGKAKVGNVFVVASAMWCLFFCRIILLSLTDISLFHAVDLLHISAGFPILCIAAVISLQLFLSMPFNEKLIHYCRADTM